jgi:hypothetical protein
MQSGADPFNQPVEEAVKQWVFRPAHSDGREGMGCFAFLEFDFVLRDGTPTVLSPY